MNTHHRSSFRCWTGFATTLAVALATSSAASAATSRHHKDGVDAPPTVAWDSIEARMKREAEHGFSGVVLVARDGKIVFHKAYGMANREKKIPMRPDTILAIGSTPIDFTKAGILLLADRGKLKLSDSITKYCGNVPEDKRAITIQHLMTGRSGLPDFHELPTDRDPDHGWIDRAEAVRRIMNQKLLFSPGQERRHSHSAFGLLAAIIEIVSGQSYPEFTREHLFKPAGLMDTGFFGERYAEERMAVGYGPGKDGEVNAPPYWGKTSWLVMGSGGQVSTALDMWRWLQAVYGGKLLSPDSLNHYTSPPGAILAGGDMYGFEIMYAGNQRSCMIVMSNGGTPKQRPQLRKLGEALAALVTDRKLARFTLGVKLDVGDNGRLRIAELIPGGAAERQGLRAGDVLLKAGGKELEQNPGQVLGALLESGEPITFEMERGGQRQTVTVKPAPQDASGGEGPTAVLETPNPGRIELRTKEVSLPMRWFMKKPVVEVKINGKGPYRLYLDTGAQGSVLDQALADELKLPVVGEARVGSPGGKGLPAKQVRLERMEIGGAVLSDLPAVAFDRSFLDRGKETPRGVLSAKTFPGFLVTLNYPQSRLTIQRGGLPDADGEKVFAYDAKRRLPQIPVSVAGRELNVHLDSGSPGGITLPLELAERLPLVSKPVEIGRGRRVDQDVVIWGAKLNGNVKIGQYVLEKPDLSFQDIPNAPGHVGYEVLKRFAVTLDSSNHRIRLEQE
jgi:CubicO group peptidase (beta-lactamase class C family)